MKAVNQKIAEPVGEFPQLSALVVADLKRFHEFTPRGLRPCLKNSAFRSRIIRPAYPAAKPALAQEVLARTGERGNL
ncbi:MAG: hypothetical protein OQK99_01435, partial [Gammaproteobacteria bacterium]|nr:hypothetical protein [Gammaproteobacteria bacterium]